MADCSEFWQNLLSTFLGTGTAVGIFYLESYRERKKEKGNKKEISESTLEYFTSLLDSSLKLTHKQLESYSQHSQNILNFPLRSNLLEIVIAEDLNRILYKLDHSAVFQSFILRYGGKKEQIVEFQKLYNHLDYILSLYKQANNNQETYLRRHNESLHKYRDIAEEKVMFLCAKLLNSIRKDTPNFSQDRLWNMLNNAFVNYYQNAPNPPTVEYLHSHFLIVIREEIINNFRDIPECMEIADLCRKGTWQYNDIVFQSNHIANDFSQYSTRLTDSLKDIKDIMDKLAIPSER